MSTCKVICCTSCVHRNVCSLKSQFLEAQRAIDDCAIQKSEPIGDGAYEVSMTYIRNIDFIKPVTLECAHYIKKEEVVTK